jgi:signal transduction histidine kinase
LIEQIDTLSNIATEFSGFAQMPTAHVTQFDLDQVLQSVADLYAEHDTVKVRFNSLDGAPHLITADRDQMMRVFSNLVKNGVQATEEIAQGKVDIEIGHKDGNVQVMVRDNGKGIPEELKSRIFTPNFTTKTGGTGLGLAICKQIVAQFGGTITFESEHGSGTRFILSMKASDDIVN